MLTPDHKPYLRRWRIVLLALLCVAGSQLAIAGHQFQHDELLVSDSCAVCVQLEQLDGPTPDVERAPAAPTTTTSACQSGTFVPTMSSFAHYYGRAPPGF